MVQNTGYKNVRVSRLSDPERIKRDGYGANKPPEAMISTKPGKLPGKGYSGPTTARV